MHGRPKGNKHAPPPMLRPVPREDSVEKLGVQISETGTLQLDLQNGECVAVRPLGTSAPSGDSGPGPPELLGKIRWDDLKMGHVIGEGSQAKVRKVKHRPTGIIYALKIITLGKQVTKRTLQQELSRVFTATNHPNVVASADAFYIEGALKILMEYMDLGTLQEVLKQIGPIPEPALKCITKQILQGLATLHASDIVHRDIKPSNLLINSSGMVKISDFGVSTFLNTVNPFAVTLIGSTAYMSPERVQALPYDAKSDIWSVGLTVAQCALGVFPFFTDKQTSDPATNQNPFERKVNMFDLAAMIAESRAVVNFDTLLAQVTKFYPQWPTPTLSNHLKDFVQGCMSLQPADRSSCQELLQHPFITSASDDFDLKRWLREQPALMAHKEKDGASTSSLAAGTPNSGSNSGTTASPFTGSSPLAAV